MSDWSEIPEEFWHTLGNMSDEQLAKLVRLLGDWGVHASEPMTPLEEHLWAVRSTKREKALVDFKKSELIR